MSELRLVALASNVQVQRDDDLVTLLWDEAFEHVTYQQYDSFAEGEQDERAKFEGERQEVVAGGDLAAGDEF